LSVNVVLIIVAVCLLISNRLMHRRISRFFGVRTARAIKRAPGNENLEQMLLDYLDYVRRVSDRNDQTQLEIGALNEKMSHCLRNIGVVRYNPFENMGGDFSFSLALLDETGSGVVISNLVTRDGSNVYLKRINRMESKRRLSAEETEAIRLAAQAGPRRDAEDGAQYSRAQ